MLVPMMCVGLRHVKALDIALDRHHLKCGRLERNARREVSRKKMGGHPMDFTLSKANIEYLNPNQISKYILYPKEYGTECSNNACSSIGFFILLYFIQKFYRLSPFNLKYRFQTKSYRQN